MSKSFKSDSFSSSSDPKTGCASLDCPKDQTLKSKSASKDESSQEEEEECLENCSPEE